MLSKIHKDLGIPSSYSNDTELPLYEEPLNLDAIELDIFDRPQFLLRQAAEKWNAMKLAACKDAVELLVDSAFRSVDYQVSLIKAKLQKGRSIEDILQTNTAPGHSEHHSGRALDLTTLNCEPLSENFDNTDAFRWLTTNAHEFDFTLSYPKNNEAGIIYESKPFNKPMQSD
jgi:D-alanyl-D-alanine carboxypeptidase